MSMQISCLPNIPTRDKSGNIFSHQPKLHRDLTNLGPCVLFQLGQDASIPIRRAASPQLQPSVPGLQQGPHDRPAFHYGHSLNWAAERALLTNLSS
jgi:hypothetical protein